jgi:hypothetical protein
VPSIRLTIRRFSRPHPSLLARRLRPPRPDTLIQGCEASQGAAVYAEDSQVTLTRCNLNSNAAMRGGAVFATGPTAAKASTVALNACSLGGNRAAYVASAADGGMGGAVGIQSYAAASIARTLLLSNSADRGGGGLACEGCELRVDVVNTIAALNSVSAGGTLGGGGIGVYGAASFTLGASTLVGNSAAGAAGSALAGTAPGAYAPPTVSNTLFSGPPGAPLVDGAVAVAHSVWPGKPAPCAACGAGVVDADPLLVRGALALPAGTLGPTAFWRPTASSPGNRVGSAAAGLAVDFLGNLWVGGGWGGVGRLGGTDGALFARRGCGRTHTKSACRGSRPVQGDTLRRAMAVRAPPLSVFWPQSAALACGCAPCPPLMIPTCCRAHALPHLCWPGGHGRGRRHRRGAVQAAFDFKQGVHHNRGHPPDRACRQRPGHRRE